MTITPDHVRALDAIRERARRWDAKAERLFSSAERARRAGDQAAADDFERAAIGYADAARNLRVTHGGPIIDQASVSAAYFTGVVRAEVATVVAALLES